MVSTTIPDRTPFVVIKVSYAFRAFARHRLHSVSTAVMSPRGKTGRIPRTRFPGVDNLSGTLALDTKAGGTP